MRMIRIYCILFFTLPFTVKAQEVINLYPGKIPNARETTKKETIANSIIRGVTNPTLEVYLPGKEQATGAAVIICPGGSYSVLVYEGEGVRTAKEFSKQGIAAFVLKYRIPDDSTMIDKTIGPLQDAQQAIKTVREKAATWNIKPDRIGIMGFSAGGHLASTAATHYQPGLIENSNNTSVRPDFLVLVYPVISMQDSLTHRDSRKNLLGSNPSIKLLGDYSNELRVDGNTPPAYITHAGDDKLVIVQNSIRFYEAMRRNNVPAELHIYPKGGHGFVFSPQAEGWMTDVFRWMKNAGIIQLTAIK